MKKFIVFFFSSFVILSFVKSQDEPIYGGYSDYEKGSKIISIGLGFPNLTNESIDFSTGLFDIDADNGTSTPFYMGIFEYGVTENISLGVYSGYFKSKNSITALAQYAAQVSGTDLGDVIGSSDFSVFSVGGKLGVHKSFVKNIDTYASTYLGYNFVNDDVNVAPISITGIPIIDDLANTVLNQGINSISYPTITYEVNAGAKYFFNENIGIYAEAGVGRFLVNVGASFKLD